MKLVGTPKCPIHNTINEIWLGLDGVHRYVCEHCSPLTIEFQFGNFIKQIRHTKLFSSFGVYVNHCWNCYDDIDSRICERDDIYLYKCRNCGEDLRNRPGNQNFLIRRAQVKNSNHQNCVVIGYVDEVKNREFIKQQVMFSL